MRVFTLLGASWVLLTGVAAGADTDGTATYGLLRKDVIVHADVWSSKPQMIAAGLGFTNIIGVSGISTKDLGQSEQLVRAAGGTWNTVSCASSEVPGLNAYTSASAPQAVAFSFGFPAQNQAGLPVEFSWPIRPSTLKPTDFRVTLNNGQVVTPQLASIFPNEEYNERSVAVLFGSFGNLTSPSDPGSVYPVLTKVVKDGSPLQLVGPGGEIASAVGLSAKASGSPYSDPVGSPKERSGPRLVGAKLSRLSAMGEGAPKPFSSALPNDGISLYGNRAKYRLRVYTSGGFSPDGVRAVFPTEFSRYFKLRAEVPGADDVLLTKANRDYKLAGHTIRILGLADLGRKQSNYDDCYTEDKDNYIDIVMSGDLEAVRRITHVEIPAVGNYSAFFNPGGPGNNPTPGVSYSSAGPQQSQRVMHALSDPLTVTYRARLRR